jgi:hypothetical protein
MDLAAAINAAVRVAVEDNATARADSFAFWARAVTFLAIHSS